MPRGGDLLESVLASFIGADKNDGNDFLRLHQSR